MMIALFAAPVCADASAVFGTVEAGLLLPQGQLQTAAQSGSAFALSGRWQITRTVATGVRAGYTQLAGNRNDKLRLSLAPLDWTVQAGFPFESGFVPYAAVGASITGIWITLGSGRMRGADAGLVAETGVDLHADSGLGIGLGIGGRAMFEGAGDPYWAAYASLRVSIRLRGRPVWS